MTVKELIEKLSKVEDDSLPVMVWDPFNDRSTPEVHTCMLWEGKVLISNTEIGRVL